MTWLGQESDEWLIPFIDAYLDAKEQEYVATERRKEAEEDLLEKLVAYELDWVERGSWRIGVILPDEGDAYLKTTWRKGVDFGPKPKEESSTNE